MINKKHFITVALLLGFLVFTFAQKMGELTFIEAGDKIINCQSPLSSNAFISSAIYDFDKDGLQDLIICTYSSELRFYKNTGTEHTPAYNDFTLIQSSGEKMRIYNPS
jgi:hypothetical protein